MATSLILCRSVLTAAVLGLLFFWYCQGPQSQSPSRQWYKGNTHTHTTVSDGDTDPAIVVQWYHDRGYNFLSLTDHNKFVDPTDVDMPHNLRADFILIPGERLPASSPFTPLDLM